MQLPQIPKIGRLSKKHKITAAGAAAATAVVLAVTGLQATGGSSSAAAVGDPTGYKVATADQTKTSSAPKTDSASQKALSDQAAAQKKAAADAAAKKAAAEALAKKKAAAAEAARKTAERRAAAEAAAKRAAHQAAVKRAAERAAANRSTQRATLKVVPVAATTPAPVKTYTNDLDGWIKHSLDIMAADHIPGSYNGIYRNIIRESSGNPNAINLWDSNAAKGIPSKGLLQVIDPTFQAYHVAGTSWNIYDPVANITAACNYAYHVYGSMDNVNSAY
ncbi:transglycosylase SLT domain-containing protein [Actinacidiphila acidipaludis]|uniref:Transglycosylase SLT domain-containing protein n=1 Tax=Actinacidiphila acidipaludis TaxID=2873382 RepID=A0ABS7QEM4_9ACTN|nr:transglycosylase SLT domain-containing protein [Streptomyces acidipaludis]MBY8880382.1 transglycosylase SLT domain-containing protein [Streptomyces acidipaludis]